MPKSVSRPSASSVTSVSSSLSRGAIHHHFDSIPDLMAAVTRDVGERIQKNVSTAMANVRPGSDIYEVGIDIIWDQLRAPSFQALDQIRSALATDAQLRDAVNDEIIDMAKWLQQQAAVAIAKSNANSQDMDLTLVRLILSSLAGAATYDLALGAPHDDPDRRTLITTMKRMVKLYNVDRRVSAVPA